MKALTNAQLKAIEELSGMIIDTRSQLAEALCEALGEEYTWANGYVNGHGNSIVLYQGNTPIQIGTYRFRDPKSVSLKYMIYGEYAYDFDFYGKVIRAAKRVEKPFDGGVCVTYESII